MKIVVLLFLLLIIGSLASALFYLVRDKGASDRTVKSLTLRVGLSVTLFILLMLGYYFGLVPQQGL
ncbi:MAG: twin transmembrane helix small protein [Burkholderiales bacterium]|nr:twin transmembrane helix small protein [Burkholderiales bacterium]